MYIHNREEALDALAEVLALPERRDQIIQMTVKVMVCLEPDARHFMVDCAAGLIEGGLEFMKRKRQEMLAAMAQKEGGEAIVIVDTSEDQLIEAVGTAMDALRLAGVIAEVFPELASRHAPWELARAVLGEEQSIQQAVVGAVKERGGDRKVPSKLEKDVEEKVAAARPPWFESADTLRKAIEGALPADGQADLILGIVALDDTRAQLALDLAAAELKEYLGEIQSRIEKLQKLEKQAGG